MRSFTTIILTTLVSSLASAQYTIDPNSVALSTREIWCTSQEAACPLICLQYPGTTDTTESNTCDATSLSYSCVCSNGISPNASMYSQTLPYFVCTEWGSQCVTNCNGNATCGSDCRSLHPCGAQNPTRVNTSTISTMMSTSTGTPAGASVGASGTVYTGYGGAAATTTAASGSGSTSGSTLAFEVGHAYGLVIIAAGLFGGFALLI